MPDQAKNVAKKCNPKVVVKYPGMVYNLITKRGKKDEIFDCKM